MTPGRSVELQIAATVFAVVAILTAVVINLERHHRGRDSHCQRLLHGVLRRHVDIRLAAERRRDGNGGIRHSEGGIGATIPHPVIDVDVTVVGIFHDEVLQHIALCRLDGQRHHIIELCRRRRSFHRTALLRIDHRDAVLRCGLDNGNV